MRAEATTGAPEARVFERADEPITKTSPDLIVERIKANLEPLNAQILTLIESVEPTDSKKFGT